MIESFSDANDELKRVDHLIFVSLKYTRTVDVIVNIIKRIVECVEFLITAHLKYGVKKKLLKEEDLPKNKALRVEVLEKVFSDSPEVIEMAEFYMWLRKILRGKYTKIQEFKRHVALETEITNKEGKAEKVHIDIDVLEELYITKMRKYMTMTGELVKNEKQE